MIGAVIIAGVVDLFMANRVYLKKKGVVLRDMVLTSLDETARGRGRSREKNAPPHRSLNRTPSRAHRSLNRTPSRTHRRLNRTY